MRSGKTYSDPPSGVLLLAKRSGLTSFSSLHVVKHALHSGKVGHTGTLDSFAEGLLVVLTGKLTRLVPHITDFNKNYLAVIEFGTETDTLDPEGSVTATASCPTEEKLRSVLPQFTGVIEQIPPLYSAVHISGKRASDLARSGKTADMPARKVTIFSLTLLDFDGHYGLIEVTCSKGTYIRSLARDIARACDSCAHLAALRRTSIGPFKLSDAVGFSSLGDFTISEVIKKKNSKVSCPDFCDDNMMKAEIASSLLPMTEKLSEACGFVPVVLKPYYADAYAGGRIISPDFFVTKINQSTERQFAVFYPDRQFGGIIRHDLNNWSYGFVVPQKRPFVVYNWEQIVSGQFSELFRKQGTGLTIGSFDGPHIGHNALFNAVLSRSCAASGQDPLIPGVVTFTRSLRGLKNPDEYRGDVATLSQRLEIFGRKGFAFAIVIDFSDDFGRMEGNDFLSILSDKCGLRFLAEGGNFHCGYQGATGMDRIKAFGTERNFTVQELEPVMYGTSRVSSSRIRENILAGAFAPAEYMLDRPFAIDCTGFKWMPVLAGGMNFIETKTDGIQVLPPAGRYPVLVLLSESGSHTAETQTIVCVHSYQSFCTVSTCELRLQVSGNTACGYVRAIQFSDPEDLNSKE